MEKQFEVWVGNLGKYVEGDLEGEWLSFPTTKESIERTLDKIGIGEGYEEIMVEEIDVLGHSSYLNDIFGEYPRLDDLNMVAHLMSRLSEEEMQLTEFYVAANEGGMDIEEFANVLLQTDEIPYYPFSFPGMENCREMSEEEKYGYTVTYESGAYEKLKEIGLEDYIDFEAMGRDANLSGHVVFFPDGYMDCKKMDQVRLDLYSRRELYKEAELELEKNRDDQKPELSREEEKQIQGQELIAEGKKSETGAEHITERKPKSKEWAPIL